jgi:FAD/FMN-containing dehydrogenase
MKATVANWGNYPRVEAELKTFSNEKRLHEIFNETDELIARGLGRCYGDSSLGRNIATPVGFDRIIAFDEKSGSVTCEAGISLGDLLEIFVPRGWFLPVTPGTKFVTLGGAIAADVHGKNHHKAGNISRHVASMELMLADGSVAACSPDENEELFHATSGGMGLTGVILRATLTLKKIESAYIRQETVKAKNLEELMELFEASSDFTYSVAWVDCLAKGRDEIGRSVLIRGEHAAAGEHRKKGNPLSPPKKLTLDVPFNMPGFLLNRYTVGGFNSVYYGMAGDRKTTIVDYDSFFYPLDRIHNWNRIYGRKGFLQYQFVLPKETSGDGIKRILKKTGEKGLGSFLAVLKLMGPEAGLISFPMEGYTLALDFPVTRSLFGFLEELDEIVLGNGGRLYLAKDARMDAAMFKKSYKNSERFIEYKQSVDKSGRFKSLQSARLGI